MGTFFYQANWVMQCYQDIYVMLLPSLLGSYWLLVLLSCYQVNWVMMLMSQLGAFVTKVSKGAKIRNRYNQVPHLTQDTNGKVTNSQLDTTMLLPSQLGNDVDESIGCFCYQANLVLLCYQVIWVLLLPSQLVVGVTKPIGCWCYQVVTT